MKRYLSIITLAMAATSSFAGSVFFSGTVGGDSATFSRPNEDGSDQPSLADNVGFSVQPFYVTSTNTYTYESFSDAEDNFILLYHDSFDPKNPLDNLIAGSDDWFDALTNFPGTEFEDPFLKSKIGDELGLAGILTLTPGTTFIAVNTSFKNGDFFNFRAAVSSIGPGPGDVFLGTAPVPEPASMLALAGGLAGFLARRKRK